MNTNTNTNETATASPSNHWDIEYPLGTKLGQISGVGFSRAKEWQAVHSRIADKTRMDPDPKRRDWWPNGGFSAPDYQVWVDHHPDDPDVRLLIELNTELYGQMELARVEKSARRAEAERVGLVAYACAMAREVGTEEEEAAARRAALGRNPGLAECRAANAQYEEDVAIPTHRFMEAVGWVMGPMVIDRWFSGLHNEGTQWDAFGGWGTHSSSEGQRRHRDPAYTKVAWAYNTNNETGGWVRKDTVPPELLPLIEERVDLLHERGFGYGNATEVVEAAIRELARRSS
jgi:hypothetical protein